MNHRSGSPRGARNAIQATEAAATAIRRTASHARSCFKIVGMSQ
jgi:hypothetical protein